MARTYAIIPCNLGYAWTYTVQVRDVNGTALVWDGTEVFYAYVWSPNTGQLILRPTPTAVAAPPNGIVTLAISAAQMTAAAISPGSVFDIKLDCVHGGARIPPCMHEQIRFDASGPIS